MNSKMVSYSRGRIREKILVAIMGGHENGKTLCWKPRGLVEGKTMGLGWDGIYWKNDPCCVEAFLHFPPSTFVPVKLSKFSMKVNSICSPSMEFPRRGCCFLNNQSTNRTKEDEKWIIPWVGPCNTLSYPLWAHVRSLGIWSMAP